MEPLLLEFAGLSLRLEVLGQVAALPGDPRALHLLFAAEGGLVGGQLLLLDAGLGRQLRQLELFLGLHVRLVGLELDLVADLGLELLAKGRVDDEDLGHLGGLDPDAPFRRLGAFGVDGRLEGRRDDAAQGRLPLLDALDHRHVRDGMAELAVADVGEQGRDLGRAVALGEVEHGGGRDGVGDPVDERALESQRDAVLGLLGELERGFLLRARDQHVDGARAQECRHRRAPVLEYPLSTDQQILVRTRAHDGHRRRLLRTPSPVPRPILVPSAYARGSWEPVLSSHGPGQAAKRCVGRQGRGRAARILTGRRT